MDEFHLIMMKRYTEWFRKWTDQQISSCRKTCSIWLA